MKNQGYNRHRYYDPTLGRYITQDPIGLLGDGMFMLIR
ncbi:RHS repeat-associated protein [Rahnella sp. BIGb0236]|jgi:RHS repeat-associated protein|nr:RHS repeat-associated protein [Rahnella sp. BIGb0236]